MQSCAPLPSGSSSPPAHFHGQPTKQPSNYPPNPPHAELRSAPNVAPPLHLPTFTDNLNQPSNCDSQLIHPTTQPPCRAPLRPQRGHPAPGGAGARHLQVLRADTDHQRRRWRRVRQVSSVRQRTAYGCAGRMGVVRGGCVTRGATQRLNCASGGGRETNVGRQINERIQITSGGGRGVRQVRSVQVCTFTWCRSA